MKARDVMVTPVFTVTPSTSVQEVAKILLDRRISAVPVVNEQGTLVGIISEGDLLHRAEAGTGQPHSWWLECLAGDGFLASDYVKQHALKVADLMTCEVITAAPDTPLNDVAVLLESKGIKRVPILENGQLIGIVSRANIIQAVAAKPVQLEVRVPDTTIRDELLTKLRRQPWSHTGLLNVIVHDGIVDLWGMTYSAAERTAVRVAAETTPGVRVVNDYLFGGRPRRPPT
jgi:CBS domain-containing protein